MMVDTVTGTPIDPEMVHNYFRRLVNHFFKILPMRENNEESLNIYMKSLQLELLGCQNFIKSLNDDSDLLTILSILQYLIDHSDCSVAQVKREVFRAISICNRLQNRFVLQEVER